MSILDFEACDPRYVCSLSSSRYKAGEMSVDGFGTPYDLENTNCSCAGSPNYHIVLEFQILIKYSIIKLDFAVESIPNSFPISSGI